MILKALIAIIGMAAVGWIAWRLVSAQSEPDIVKREREEEERKEREERERRKSTDGPLQPRDDSDQQGRTNAAQ